MLIKIKELYLHLFSQQYIISPPRRLITLRGFYELITKHSKGMTKEIRKDLYTQTEWAKKVGLSKARISQKIAQGDYDTVKVNGTILIKG